MLGGGRLRGGGGGRSSGGASRALPPWPSPSPTCTGPRALPRATADPGASRGRRRLKTPFRLATNQMISSAEDGEKEGSGRETRGVGEGK